jgi:acetyl esterase/lipase
MVELACALPAIVTLVSYPLAPNSPAKDSISHLGKLYQSIMQESSRKTEIVTFMGDSAGGNVAISLVLYVLSRKPEAPVPSSIFLISPCADARNNNPAMKETDKHDPLLDVKYTDEVAKRWTIGMDRSDPIVSPVLADLGILKKRGIRLDGLVGTWDVLCPDTLLLLDRAREQGLQGRWLVWQEQMHCFVLTW